MNAIEMLKEQHDEAEELFDQIEDAEGEEKRQLFEQLGDAIAIHCIIEEQHFYPSVRAHRTEDILLESLQEHLAIKRVLADMLDLDPGDELFDAKCRVLQEEMEHHIQEEEANLFAKVQRLFSSETLDEIGSMMEQTAAELEGSDPRFLVREQTVEAPSLT
jgi:hypothetical protein